MTALKLKLLRAGSLPRGLGVVTPVLAEAGLACLLVVLGAAVVVSGEAPPAWAAAVAVACVVTAAGRRLLAGRDLDDPVRWSLAGPVELAPGGTYVVPPLRARPGSRVRLSWSTALRPTQIGICPNDRPDHWTILALYANGARVAEAHRPNQRAWEVPWDGEVLMTVPEDGTIALTLGTPHWIVWPSSPTPSRLERLAVTVTPAGEEVA